LQSAALAAVVPPATILPAHAQGATGEPAWQHGLSMFGDLKYPADFKRFDYVNAGATKGGLLRQSAAGTFDNFNVVISGLKVRSPVASG